MGFYRPEEAYLRLPPSAQRGLRSVCTLHFVRNAVRRLEHRETEKGNYSFINAKIDNVRFLPLVNIENAHVSKITIIVLL